MLVRVFLHVLDLELADAYSLDRSREVFALTANLLFELSIRSLYVVFPEQATLIQLSVANFEGAEPAT